MGCCCTIPCIVWLWEWGNPLSVAASSDGSTVGSMSSSDQRLSGCMCVHVPNRCYAAPPLSPSTIYSLYILLKVLPLFRDSTNSIHIEQLTWLCRSSKWSLRTLVVSLWPSWATFMVLYFLDCSFAPFYELVAMPCWQCTSLHHDDDHQQLASNCSV